VFVDFDGAPAADRARSGPGGPGGLPRSARWRASRAVAGASVGVTGMIGRSAATGWSTGGSRRSWIGFG
jgi:hypothetical protein